MTSGADVLNRFISMIVNPAILLVFAAGFFLFVWGLVQFIRHLDDGSNRQEGVQHMIWGIVGMVVMISVQGILMLLSNTFGLGYTPGQPTKVDPSGFSVTPATGLFK